MTEALPVKPSWGLCFTAFKPFCPVGCRSSSTTIEGYFEGLLESKKQHRSVELNHEKCWIQTFGFKKHTQAARFSTPVFIRVIGLPREEDWPKDSLISYSINWGPKGSCTKLLHNQGPEENDLLCVS